MTTPTTPPSLLPDLSTLTARLTAALNGGRPVEVLERKLPPMMCTFPNEVVACRLPDGQIRRVFIKYEGGHSHRSYGHRGNLAYEAEVYRRLLRSVPNFRPKFLGAHTDNQTGETWLMLEYVNRSVRVRDISWKYETRMPVALLQATRWIASFHRRTETASASGELSFLIRYDADYFRGWAHRTREFARPLRARFPWLTELCECCEAWSQPLLAAPQSVIHGELYAEQVLLRRGELFFIDWESAAIGAGEIDLASLTEGPGRPAELISRCEEQYQCARWDGQGVPAGFRKRLDAARIYLHFRWLGERPDWTVQPQSLWRYDHLRQTAKRLGLL